MLQHNQRNGFVLQDIVYYMYLVTLGGRDLLARKWDGRNNAASTAPSTARSMLGNMSYSVPAWRPYNIQKFPLEMQGGLVEVKPSAAEAQGGRASKPPPPSTDVAGRGTQPPAAGTYSRGQPARWAPTLTS